MPDSVSSAPGSPLLGAIVVAVDPDDAVPLYHQIAAVVRREIAAGRVPIGAVLPSLRAVQLAVGVNYHTVRHAWDELSADGILSVRRGLGAVVVRAPLTTDGWRVAPADPGRGSTDQSAPVPVVWVAVAGILLAAELAGRLMTAWRVIAAPWPPDGPPPPPGTILRALSAGQPNWSAREHETAALPLAPGQGALTWIIDRARALGTSRVLLVAAPGDGDIDDLMRQLPRVGLQPTLGRADATAIICEALTVTLPSGRGLVAEPARNDAWRLDLPAVWAPGPLAGVAHQWGWRSLVK